MEDHVYFRDKNGIRLSGLLAEKGKRMVILCHGFRGSKEGKSVTKLRKDLNKLNISTFRFDFFAHGESEGKFENMTITHTSDGILGAVQFVKDIGFKEVGLVGVSYGGICAMVAAKKSKAIKYLALKAPVSDYHSLEDIRSDLKLWKKQGYIERTTKIGKTYRMNYTFIDDAKKKYIIRLCEKAEHPRIYRTWR